MKLAIHSKSSVHMSQDDFVISVAECARGRSRGIRMLLQNYRTCVLKIESIFKTGEYWKCACGFIASTRLELWILPITKAECCANSAISVQCSQFGIFKCWCVLHIQTIFNPWWMFNLGDRLMLTNKTCFAGVLTGPKQSRISFLYACESKKFQTFLSADKISIPGVNQVFSPSQFLNGIWFLFCYRKFSIV